MSQAHILSRLLDRRGVLIPLASAVGLVSVVLLWATIARIYEDYWFMPHEKADFGVIVYPELRYWFFDATLLLWCFVGVVASTLSLRSVILSLSISPRTKLAWMFYFALLALLILGGIVMMVVRSYGY